MGLLGYGSERKMLDSFNSRKDALRKKSALKNNAAKYRKFKKGDAIKSESMSAEDFELFKSQLKRDRRRKNRSITIITLILAILVLGGIFILMFS